MSLRALPTLLTTKFIPEVKSRYKMTLRFQLLPHIMPDLDMTRSTLSDVSRLPKSWQRPPKPEMEITMEKSQLGTRFQSLSHILDNFWFACNTADIVRHWLLTEIQDAAINSYSMTPSWDSVVGRHQTTPKSHIQVGHCRKCGVKLNHVAVIPCKSYLDFRFTGRHLNSVIRQLRTTSEVF